MVENSVSFYVDKNLVTENISLIAAQRPRFKVAPRYKKKAFRQCRLPEDATGTVQSRNITALILTTWKNKNIRANYNIRLL